MVNARFTLYYPVSSTEQTLKELILAQDKGAIGRR